jgi:GAF domain-containing protein
VQKHDDIPSIAAALTEAAKAIHAPRSLEETLDAIAHAARITIPGFDHIGISITHKDGTIETMAGTGPLVWELDALQYGLQQGPCVDAMQSDPVMAMPDIDAETRWPDYLPGAAEKGLKSQMGLRLYTEEKTLGGLNLYSTQRRGIAPDALEVAELFATHAAIALDRARYDHDLSEAIASRQMIGTAIGIVMQRFRIDENRAFQYLARASMSSNTKLRTIAEEVVVTTNERFAATP